MHIRPSALLHAAIGAGVVGAAVLFAGQPADKPASAPAGQPPAGGMPEGMDQQKMMEQWAALMKPGKAHEGLKKSVGEWTTVTRVWMDPKAPPQEFKGSASFKMVLNDHFLQQDFKGDMMGETFTGIGLTGYDNARKQYTMCWADSMTTSFTQGTGGISPDGKTITMFGTMDEPALGEVGKHVKYVTRHPSDNTMFFEIWEVQYGDPFKVMEVEYTRKK
ncbi:MAG: DUF1579 domain-containing protein [Phycisphaerales bacterium]